MASKNENQSKNVTQSGITTDAATGERYVPSSIRADGSTRKEIKVRPGYRPPEDIELYKARAAEAWKNRGKAGVPGASAVPGADGLKAGGGGEVSSKSGGGSASAAGNKNAKKREAKKKAKASEGESATGATATATNGKDVSRIEDWRAGGEKKQNGSEAAAAEAPVDPEVEQEKKARNLKKKLKQARELSDKKSQGEALLPEQLEKVIKIQELTRQLDGLGFDSNGDKREAQEEKPEK